MTIKTVKEYIKSITIGNSAKTKVESLVTSALRNSTALSSIRTVTLDSKFTNIPFMQIPKDSESTFKIGSISITKQVKNSEATLVDETDEDTTVNMEAALDSILVSQTTLLAEKYLADYLTNTSNFPSAGTGAKKFITIANEVIKFPSQILAVEGSFVVFMSFATYLAMLASMDTAHKEIVKSGLIKLVPIYGIGDDKMAIVHTQGAAMGLELRGVERERHADKQSTKFIPQFVIGVGADKDYVRNITLTA